MHIFLYNEVIFTVIRFYTLQDDGYVNWFSLWLGFQLFCGISKEFTVGRCIEDKTRGSLLSSGKSVI